ncbi:MYXO-CTERM domain-containing protein [Nannocystis exedens]|uniref:MYXO-CTERM domain-containing protein n=1 Tax=Nannocystis exedens TaxID=54 RepID=A0A1I2FPN5_9BACT|nr:M15 family metallopeptidase [Nannocystis exedens]PCC74496.1 penicillin-resistant DD-carboxypeptidase [Nannocystis exedens]SFF06738.1 MYXO-CTERM domain-containing protein [Nannocystis exedens]
MPTAISLRHAVLAALCLAPHTARAEGPHEHPDVCELTAPPDIGEHPAPIDCAESKDTGYTNGNPFEITVVHIDGRPVEKSTANAYWVMREAAAADGVDMHINSGFRTMAEQEYLYGCYVNCNCNNCNLAAKPGYSNHQSGHALDINTATPGVYNWLNAHGGAFGFTETVPGEPWHWEWWGGGPGGGVCDISIPPQGYLDTVDCDNVYGWAQDPDAPDAAIDVHVYFNAPAGDPNGIGVPTTANLHREDLCMALGSCAHGYELGIPLSLRDNVTHPVHVYGIDIEGQQNPQLAQSPLTFTCAPPALSGVRRHITSPDILAAWKFDLFWQLVNVDEPTLLAIPDWIAIEPAPQLIRADDGTPEVYLKDGDVRRHIPSPEVADNWGFDLGAVVTVPAAEVYAIPLGTPLWDKPVLVKGPGPEVYQLDDLQCPPGSREPLCQVDDTTTGGDDPTGPAPTTGGDATGGDSTGEGPDASTGASSSDGSGGGPTGSASGTAGNDSGDAGGCACRSNAGDTQPWALGLFVLGALARRRRRAPRA